MSQRTEAEIEEQRARVKAFLEEERALSNKYGLGEYRIHLSALCGKINDVTYSIRIHDGNNYLYCVEISTGILTHPTASCEGKHSKTGPVHTKIYKAFVDNPEFFKELKDIFDRRTQPEDEDS